MYVCMCVYVYVYVSFTCRVVMDRDRVNIVLTPVFSSYFYYFCCCACVSSQSERSCSSRFNQRVYHCVFFLSLSLYFLLVSLLYALLLSFFFCLFFFFFCCLICLCVCVSQNEDQHNVFDVYLFFSRLVRSNFFLSHYILTYLKYTLNSLYKQKNK